MKVLQSSAKLQAQTLVSQFTSSTMDRLFLLQTYCEEINGGSAQIDGQKDLEEAQSLADTIKIGALPLTLNELSSQVVGAQLGTDALRTSMIAGAIGLCIIFLILIIFFRFPGFLATDCTLHIHNYGAVLPEHTSYHTDTARYRRYYPVHWYGGGCKCNYLHSY